MYGNFSTCNAHYSMSTENSMVTDEFPNSFNKHEINKKLFSVFVIYTHAY